MIVKEQVIENETRLLEAMKSNDFQILEELIHDDLLFSIPNGQIVTKAMDLETYRSGNMIINSISSSEQVINLIDDTAVVSVLIELEGNYFDQLLDGKFRYIRVWKLFGDRLKVIAGSSAQV